jgi:hypothetical protein
MKRHLLVLLCTAVLASSCHHRSESAEEDAAAPAPPVTASVAAHAPSQDAVSSGASISVKDAKGATAFEIERAGHDLIVSLTDSGKARTLSGKQQEGGKRKYAEQGKILAEVKPSDSGFKVRSDDGKTLYWKVKRDADKVKISNNEENRNPWMLVTSGDRVEVTDPGGKSVGTVRFDARQHQAVAEAVGGGVRFTSISTRPDRFLGVALMEEIPLPLRAIVMAELSSLDR